MRGFLRKRGDAWELRVYLGTDPVTGRQRYHSRTVRGGRREAERTLNQLVAEAERGALARATATFGELAEAWFEHASAGFSPTTVKETRGYLDRTILPALGSVPLTRLKASDIDRFYRHLLAGGGKDGRPLAPGTVRRVHGMVRRALGQGERWGWIGQNPAASASPPKPRPSDISPPSPQDLGRVLARARTESPELACFLRLAAATGARRSELLALRWSDVDADLATVRIAHGVVFGPNGLVVKDTKTHSARLVSLHPDSVAELARHRSAMEERATFCDVALPADAFVFSNDADCRSPWFPDSVSRSFKRLCVREGLPNARLHDLRHFVATQLLAAGVDVCTVAGRLGHRNAATTLNVYAHVLDHADRAAADTIGNVLAPSPEGRR